jgi:glycosyltransferase involved in cell wall biosynthesis
MLSHVREIESFIAEDPALSAPRRTFDGVICFGGEDWWYHNRGHYDMQMMRCLSRVAPVLYVNSIGMRMPNPAEGRMFLRRIGRKLRSIGRGAVTIDEGFTVFSPLAIPGGGGARLNRRLLSRMTRSAARARRIAQPLLWVVCPSASGVVEALDPAAVVYQRTDRYECFPGVDADRIRRLDRSLKARADLTVFCSAPLYEREADECRSACVIDHGVDFDRFGSASSRGLVVLPEDVAHLPRPRVGFVGAVDRHTFDPALFVEVARRLPEAHFVVVGPCSLPAGWCSLPNVSLLGKRAYEEVHAYMAACDVLIMPWRRSEWIEACNPIKLKEYLAVGRPVVSTEFARLRAYDGLVRRARTPAAFAEAIRAALHDPGDPRPGRDRVRGEGWPSRARTVLAELAARGVYTFDGWTPSSAIPAPRPPAHAATVPLSAGGDRSKTAPALEAAGCAAGNSGSGCA